jgi:3-oxoacyl-[acyl-carrier-protein] synthase-1/3-oxoacyl-[acyl-carrier-protein] synthase II
MSDAAILAFGAISALGEGRSAVDAGTVGERATAAIARDAELEAAGLGRPFVARAHVPDATSDRAAWLLGHALDACTAELDGVRPGWRDERVGLIVGTSSGGMRDAERAFEAVASGRSVEAADAALYDGPVRRVLRERSLSIDPVLVVLGACASSVLAIGLGTRWLATGTCDLVLAGGFDEVTVFVAAGFECLRATTASPPPRPFRVGRDGMALGEGAGIIALARASSSHRARAFVTGFGAACDAVHLTAPDREGRGLATAAKAALLEAGRPSVDLVSPHATATPFNDPVEAQVLASILRERAPVVAPFKARIGHTLGAAGVLETLACIDAMERRVLPATPGSGAVDPEAPVRMLDVAEAGEPTHALKTACAFGGLNAALVVSTHPGPTRASRSSFTSAPVHVAHVPTPEALAARIALARATSERLARGDDLVRLVLAAVAELRASGAAVEGAGLVVASSLATLETNALFAARIRERGARMAEPRRFPYTSPNTCAGEASIVFGMTGPGFTVVGGLRDALTAATALVRGGDATRVVAVGAEDVGPAAAALGLAKGRVSCASAVLVSALDSV